MGSDRDQPRGTCNLDGFEKRYATLRKKSKQSSDCRPDPRFKIGVPMLGCPSYRVLMRQRAAKNDLPFGPPHMPDSLLALLSRIDPDSADFKSTSSENPFLGKKVLICHGDRDDLVPWEAGKAFVDSLEVGPHGKKKVVIEPGQGHATSALMVEELSKWIAEHGLAHEEMGAEPANNRAAL